MGPEKKKRKSAGALPASSVKERRTDEDYPLWKDHSGYTVLQLQNSQRVLFVGEAVLQVLQGAVRVAGKLVTAESPPLVLSTGGRFGLSIDIAAEVQATQVPFTASHQVVELSLQSRPPLHLQGNPGSVSGEQPQQQGRQGAQQQGAGQPSREGGASAPSSAPLAASPCTTFALHRVNDPRAPPSLVVSKAWAQAVDDLCSAAASGAPLVLAVLGAKGMGKSSLSRLVANRLLDCRPVVAFLDTDVGQPEFTPPGLLSLHLMRPDCPALGPPHAHARQPWTARFVGDISPQHDPQLYLSAVQALYGSYWSWAQGLVASGAPWPPLVVNTHGWVKGLGFDLLTQLLRVVAPTHVVQIRGGAEKKNLPRGAFWCDPRHTQAAAASPAMLITLETLVDAAAVAATAGPGAGTGTAQGGSDCGAGADGAPEPSGRARGGDGGRGGAAPGPQARSLKPVESRALSWHAWAKRVVGAEPAWGSYESDDFWRNAGSLASLPPWTISLDHVHVQLLAGTLAPQQLGRLLNGSVVGLLATSPPQPLPLQQSKSRDRPAAAVAAAPGEAAVPAWWDVDEAAAAAAYAPGRVSYIGASSVPPPALPCVGLGIVRAVDMSTRTLFLLTDVDEGTLESVGVLTVGRLELPGSLVVGGEVAWPYQQLFGLSAEATGAGAGKARKNLSRSSLVELAG